MSSLTREPIDVAAMIAAVTRPDCGAVATFLGTVRAMTGSDVTEFLEYEGYPELSERVFATIENDCRLQWDVRGFKIVHRLGRVDVSEVSVAVAVSCPHRADALAACQRAIDRIKAEAPIWKREHSPEGGAHWVHPGVTA